MGGNSPLLSNRKKSGAEPDSDGVSLLLMDRCEKEERGGRIDERKDICHKQKFINYIQS